MISDSKWQKISAEESHRRRKLAIFSHRANEEKIERFRGNQASDCSGKLSCSARKRCWDPEADVRMTKHRQRGSERLKKGERERASVGERQRGRGSNGDTSQLDKKSVERPEK